MTDDNKPKDAHFDTNEVEANRAREQGLGLGERELNAQRDPAVDDFDDETDTDTGVERNTIVQGQDMERDAEV